jgi:hypothetical protein
MRQLSPLLLVLCLTACSTVVGAGARSQGATDGPAAEARLNGPVSLTTDIVGNLYFVEFNGNAVRKMTPDGTVNAPTGIFFDGQVMYIADRDNHRVRKIDQCARSTGLES